MKTRIIALIASAVLVSPTHGGSRTSANYSITSDSVDLGGSPTSSASYSSKGNAAGLCCGTTSATSSSGPYVAKSGFVGQLYDPVGFVIVSDSSTLPEGGSLQLVAARLLDDASRLALPATSIAWSVENGPLTSIDVAGVASAGTVYTHTNATARGEFESLTSTLLLTVLNVNRDDLPGYASDQIDDDWQVQYFGLPPNPAAAPNIDADGSGHGNLFKFVAGLHPLDGSRFMISSAPVSGESTQMSITFRPVVDGRSYVVRSSHSLVAPDWPPLANSSSIDTGDTRTVIDFSALPAPKFYRVEITKQ